MFAYIVDELSKHTIIVTMGAGGIHTVGSIKRLQFIASSTKEGRYRYNK